MTLGNTLIVMLLFGDYIHESDDGPFLFLRLSRCLSGFQLLL